MKRILPAFPSPACRLAAKRASLRFSSRTALAAGLRAALLWIVCIAAAEANTISLTDGNSTVTLDPYSSSGVSNWTVDGTNQLYQQWFWYRLSGSSLQASIDTLGTPTITQSPLDPSVATLTYAGSNGLTVTVKYSLMGGDAGSGWADMSEQIKVLNKSQTTQMVHFYQYSNFVLGNSTTSNYVQFQNANDVVQTNGGETMAETVIAPPPNYRETGEVLPTTDPNYTTLDTLYKLTNVPWYQLNEMNSDSSPPDMLGPGNVTWAYEWDRTLAPNSSFSISKDKQISGALGSVPEPSSIALALAGLLAVAGLAIRRARSR